MAAGDARVLLAAGVLTMLVTPLAVRMAPHLAAGERLLAPLERILGLRGIHEPATEHGGLTRHVVVVGYGVAGRILAEALRRSGVPYLVLELNADTVRRSRDAGEPVYYGDVTSEEALRHARVQHARALVIMINDPEAARRAIDAAAHFAPDTPVLVRCRYASNRRALLALGAADVVVEELESGLEMLTRVLERLGVPADAIMDQRRNAASAGSAPS